MRYPSYELKWSGSGGMLRNGKSHGTIVECNPNSEADVGVLACGMSEYCMDAASSSLGGVCVSSTDRTQQRVLHIEGYGNELCPGSEGLVGCDCTSWDSGTSTGTVECYANIGCLEACDNAVCAMFSLTYTSDEYSAMYILSATYTGSYQQNLQITGQKDVDGMTSCDISLDRVSCTFCTYYNSTCLSYDCTNVGMGSHDCEDNSGYYLVAPIVASCIFSQPDECNLCSDGAEIVDENQTVDLPFGTYTCGTLYSMAETYNYGVACLYLISLAEEPCCSSDGFNATDAPEESPDDGDDSSSSRDGL